MHWRLASSCIPSNTSSICGRRRTASHYMQLFTAVFAVLATARSTLASVSPNAMNSIALQWNFDDGRNGWGQSTSLEMGVEVDAGDGRLRGVVLSSGNPTLAFVDSPELRVYVGADERDYLVLRMKYLGQCDLAMISLERSPSESTVWPDADPRVMNDPIRIPFKLHTNVLEQEDLYFIPIWKHVTGVIRRVRFHPCISRNTITGQSFSIDWVAFTKAPVVTKVRGCIDKYFDDDGVPGRSDTGKTAHHNCTETERWVNGFHPSSAAICSSMRLPRASTYNCVREGGELITISGKHFGTADAVITIDGVECLEIVHVVPEVELQCRLPPAASKWLEKPTYPSVVRVYNGRLLQLFDEIPLLSYAAPVSAPPKPILSNVAAHALDVNWKAPTDVWMSMTVTGYRVAWKLCTDEAFSINHAIVVGNVTSTTLIELKSSTRYQVKVTPLTENQWRWSKQWKEVDLYGHRQILSNAVIGIDSSISSCVKTLSQDFAFPHFSARLLTNLSASPEAVALRTTSTLGPTGEVGDQGHFGLYVNGDAHVENCNASVSCCDGFDATAPSGSTAATERCSHVCFERESRSAIFINGSSHRSLPTNAMAAVPFPAKQVYVFDKSQRQPGGAAPIAMACGPTLRLTASQSFLTGAAWYPRQMNVREGFSTSFSFRAANPSTMCKVMDNVHTNCRSRGGDGFAFVVQNDVQQELALGSGGMALGYGGLQNALAIEFDTWFNPELLDVYENHISVHVSGTGGVVQPNHTHSLGATSNLPDLTEDIHTVRITYNPNLDENMLFDGAFTASTLAGNFFSTGAWRSGIGLLAIYLDDMNSPALTVPLRIENTLELFHGRAWVGFTGATGANAWQTLDILSWDFDSLRLNIVTTPQLEDWMKRMQSESTDAAAAPNTELLNRQDFIDMNQEMHKYDEMREKIIKRSREILKASKQAIFALHRADKTEALKLLGDAEKVIPELVVLTEKNPSLRDGALSSSLEEYAEAKCFCYYLDTKCLLPRREVPIVQKNEYLGGVIDFTGELMRYAVVKATAREVDEVKRCKAMVEAISGELIQFDFRNGPLRRKFDSVKYNLRKLENTLYELSLVTNSGLTLQAHSVQELPTDSTRKDEE